MNFLFYINDIMSVLRKILLGIAVIFLMTGCTMRPPSAGAFMAAYHNLADSSRTMIGGSFSKYAALSPKPGETAEDSIRFSNWNYVVKHEWKIDGSFSFFHFINHFEIGCGFQFMNPYITLGFASEHFGVMGWTDWGLLGLFYKEPEAIRGGVSLMEQITPTPKMLIGLIQFASRTRAYYWAGDDNFREPYPYSFIEYGGGAYFIYKIKSRLHLGMEFKYSYDITYHAHRLAFNFNALWGFKTKYKAS